MRLASLTNRMGQISDLIGRDTKASLRSGSNWQLGLVFFILFIVMNAIALGGNFAQLRPMAPALIWMALVLSLMLSFDQTFRDDFDDDSLLHLKLMGLSLFDYIIAKMINNWIFTILPLLLCLPLAAILLNLDLNTFAGLFLSVLIASPALLCYGGFSSACLVGQKSNGILLVVLTLPVLLPILIFGIESVNKYRVDGIHASEFLALAGLSLIAIAIGIPAMVAVLLANLEA